MSRSQIVAGIVVLAGLVEQGRAFVVGSSMLGTKKLSSSSQKVCSCRLRTAAVHIIPFIPVQRSRLAVVVELCLPSALAGHASVVQYTALQHAS